MPTPEQIREYVNQLPPIYRDILAAFPEIAPDRSAGDGFSTSLLLVYLGGRGRSYSTEEVMAAVERLEDRGFLQIEERDLIVITPTPIGEDLIATITGKSPRKRPLVPELPKPTW